MPRRAGVVFALTPSSVKVKLILPDPDSAGLCLGYLGYVNILVTKGGVIRTKFQKGDLNPAAVCWCGMLCKFGVFYHKSCI